ncbi:MAG TPA: asparagine synthase (glutamine-hydrolyzing) [Nitrospirales bacterium]|nr:asparagine synthase (glutamine-hydrolyzing) [Nitrospiraceae bacterium]HNP29161.1 asparagine synthase (glutamine-hydrolyzing) [Nitrospirales bacterium]
MCGIAGHISLREQPSAQQVAALVRGIRHRGPDDSGLWVSPGKECVLGHARLSVIDLSPLGHQPMIDPETGNALVFNGEIYNFQALRKECEAAGDTFRSHSDTEVILALYRRLGVTCLAKLRGMFAFALWDERQKRLFLVRDRVGKKPLNYALTKRGIIFASEIDPLARHPELPRQMDEEALDLYLQLQYIPAPWSIYKSIRKLPPAHYAIYDHSGLQVQKYWDVSYYSTRNVSEQDALDGLEEKLKEAIRLRMIADVPLGAVLSGGVDSSVVVALMAGQSLKPVKTFSIGFKEEAFNELPYAQMVADRYHTEHYPESVDAAVEPLLCDIVRHYGEPFADSSAIPSFHVSRAARNHVTVVMNGDGGDELLGGYPRYWLKQLSVTTGHLLGNWHTPERLAELAVGLDKAKSFSARLKRKWLLRVAHPELQSIIMYSAFWNDEERALLLDKPSSLLQRWHAQWLGDGREAAGNPIDRMLWIDNRTYLPGDLLVKMDIASMHYGLEARSPLLDHEVIEFCASLPVHLKVRGGTGKYLLKKLAERYLPKEVIYRRKMGFAIPVAHWLRGPLAPLIEDVLFDASLMEPLNGAVIRKTVREFREQRIDHSSRLWALLMYGLWRRYCVVCS